MEKDILLALVVVAIFLILKAIESYLINDGDLPPLKDIAKDAAVLALSVVLGGYALAKIPMSLSTLSIGRGIEETEKGVDAVKKPSVKVFTGNPDF